MKVLGPVVGACLPRATAKAWTTQHILGSPWTSILISTPQMPPRKHLRPCCQLLQRAPWSVVSLQAPRRPPPCRQLLQRAQWSVVSPRVLLKGRQVCCRKTLSVLSHPYSFQPLRQHLYSLGHPNDKDLEPQCHPLPSAPATGACGGRWRPANSMCPPLFRAWNSFCC